MSRISFRVDIPPVAKARPKFRRNGHAYTPDKTRAYESKIELAARQAMKGKKLLKGALIASMSFYLPIPKSWSKIRQQNAAVGIIFPTVRPDIDNYIKAVLDAMNRAVYGDDCQVTDIGRIKKRYSRQPRVEITVEEMFNENQV